MRFGLPSLSVNQMSGTNSMTGRTFLLTLRRISLLSIFIGSFFSLFAQDAGYEQVVRERSRKILNVLQLSDSTVFYKALDLLAAQYVNLNAIHDKKAQDLSVLKKDSTIDKQSAQLQATLVDSLSKSSLRLLHQQFLAALGQVLNQNQIEQVKDGMTYRVFPITVAAYQDMLPGLNEEQKTKIIEWLKEARELAMDEGSSNKKHEVFGKYKGRINNYLSAQGYDMQKQSRDWEERIKARKNQPIQ